MYNSTSIIESLSEITEKYNYYIIDLWGVLHDGTAAYPGALDCLKKLREAGKKIILLSNAPRRAFKAAEVLEKLGFTEDLYDLILTSGEITYSYCSDVVSEGSNYIYIGPEKDRDLLNGLDLNEVSEAKDADFAVATGFEGFGSIFAEKENQLNDALVNQLTLLCANPDRKVVRQDGAEQICAGLMGEYYEGKGGETIYFGKPYPKAYDECLKFFNCEKIEEVLCIGDSFHTDIEGGNKSGCATLMCAGGIYAKDIIKNDKIEIEKIADIVEGQFQVPNYVISSFVY